MKRLPHLFLLAIIVACRPTIEETVIEQDFCIEIHRSDSVSLSEELATIADQMKTQTGVYVLEDGNGSLITRAWLSEYAEETIDIQYFIFSTDNVGLIAIDYIVRAADRGVKIRILVDDILIDAEIEDVLMLDSHKNIDIKIYNPMLNLGKGIFGKIKSLTTDFRNSNQRMHNKTFIVDDKVVITGGRNIADEYFDYDHEYNFRDRDVLLLGKVTNIVSNSFSEFWDSDLSVDIKLLADEDDKKLIDPNRFEILHQYACNPENFWPQIRSKIKNLPATFKQIRDNDEISWLEDVSFISDIPGKNDGSEGLGGGGATTDALIQLLKNAQKSIEIQSPYLVTTSLSRDIFQSAVERGVKIRILTNSLASTDNLEAFSGYQRNREELLATGVRIFEFRPDAAVRREIMTGALQRKLDFSPIFGHHAKSMVIDGKITVIGTFNLDPRSANLNTECITVINSEEVAKGVLAGMEIEFLPENSWETTVDFNPDDFAGNTKQVKTWTRKIVPKGIL